MGGEFSPPARGDDPGSAVRVGLGFDAHSLVGGRPLVLGGVSVPFPRGLSGHSDGDLLTHAIIDALLGAAGLGDKGAFFPPGDPKYKDVSSLLLLSKVAEMLKANGWQVLNLDATIVAQRPRLGPFFGEMKSNLSTILGVDEATVSVKATTTDGMGFTGRQEGMAALAVALLEERS